MASVPPLSSSHLCPIGAKLPLPVRVRRHEMASVFQALWRGYKVRKTEKQRLALIFEKDIEALLPMWRHLNETYNMCVASQSLLVQVNKNNSQWDATQSPFYRWMLENGPSLEEVETSLQWRGWSRPKGYSKPLSVMANMIAEL